MPVDCGLRSPGSGYVEEDHTLGRGRHPRQEPAHVVEVHGLPCHIPGRQELEEQLQAHGIRPNRVGRALQRHEVSQVGLDRFDRLEVGVDNGDRASTGARHQHHLDTPLRLCWCSCIEHTCFIEHLLRSTCKTWETSV